MPYGLISLYLKKQKFEGNNQKDCFFEEGVKIYKGTSVNNVSVGKYTYISSGTSVSMAKIGRYCSIGHNVKIGIGMHPSKNIVSTHPAFFSTKGQSDIIYADKDYFAERKLIVIGNDVWIGDNVIVKDGVKIGDGVIIGVGAVITKDVEPFTIVGGIPAKLIRKRFSDSEIEFLEKFKWWNKPNQWIKENWKDFLDIKQFIKNNES